MEKSEYSELSEAILRTAEKVGPSVARLQDKGRGSLGCGESSFGSGIVLSGGDHVVTNAHIIEEGTEPLVTIPSGQRTVSTLVGRDELTDVALLSPKDRLGAEGVEFAESTSIQAGRLLVALGNSTGLDWTVSMGILSAVNCSARTDTGVALDGLLQTDAAISHNNSGGPLVTLDGALVGMNTNAMAVGESMGFAVPAAVVGGCVQQLLAHGTVSHPWLGLVGHTEVLDSRWVELFELPVQRGVFVTRVLTGGPAQRGGVQPFDLVVEINGEKIGDIEELRARVKKASVGETVELRVFRGLDFTRLELTVQELPGELRRKK